MFGYWYNTPDLLHEQLQIGLMQRCMFRPPILFETKEIKNPSEKLEFVVQECGDQEVSIRAIRLDGWPVETLEESPLAKATPPGINAAHLRTIKGTFLRSTYTPEEGIIESLYTAANFSEIPIDGGTTIVLLLYGLDAEQMKESGKIIIKHAGDITGAANLRIRPSTATLVKSNDDGAGREPQTTVSLPNNTQGGRHKGKRSKRKKDDQPEGTPTQVEHNETWSKATVGTRIHNNRVVVLSRNIDTGEIGDTMAIDHDNSEPPPPIPRKPEDYNSDDDEMLPNSERGQKIPQMTLDPQAEMRLTDDLFLGWRGASVDLKKHSSSLGPQRC